MLFRSDMKGAFLGKRVRLKDSKGRETLIEGIRFVSRNNVHRMGIRLYVTPLNYSGIIEVESIIDGTIINFYDAPRFKVKHTYMTANEKLAADGCYVEVATRENHLHVGCGCRIEAYADGKQILGNRMISRFGEQSVEFGDIHVEEGKEVEIVKYVSMYTERECPAYALHTTIEKEIEASTGKPLPPVEAVEEVQAAAPAEETYVEQTPVAQAPSTTYQASYFLYQVVQAEAGPSYQEKLNVASVIMNSVASGIWGGTPIDAVLYASGQFSVVANGAAAAQVPSAETIQAVNEVLNGYRSTSAQSFRASGDGVTNVFF